MTTGLILAATVALGSCVQWLTGMGFALVSVPVLILLLGPADGVVLANCASGAICLVGLAGGWQATAEERHLMDKFLARSARYQSLMHAELATLGLDPARVVDAGDGRSLEAVADAVLRISPRTP